MNGMKKVKNIQMFIKAPLGIMKRGRVHFFLLDPVYFTSDDTDPVEFSDWFLITDPVEIWIIFGLASEDSVEYLGAGEFSLSDTGVYEWVEERF